MKHQFSREKRKKILKSLSVETEDPFVIKEGKFEYKNLKDSVYYSDWTEESFLQQTEQKDALVHSFNYNNLKYFLLILVFGFLILFARSFWLQIMKSDQYAVLAEGNRIRSISVEPKRGIIYDHNFKPLVRNSANFVLYLRPIDLPRDELERDNLLRKIALIISGKISDEVLEELESDELDLVADTANFYELKEKLSKVRIGSLESYQPLFVANKVDWQRIFNSGR